MAPMELQVESQLYYPGDDTILLCESCCIAEDAAVEKMGSNNIPVLLETYF